VFLMERQFGAGEAEQAVAALPSLINIGRGEDLSIRELAETVMQIVGLTGEIVFDATKPDGTPRKLLDTSRINQLGWHPRTPLRKGIRLSYQDFLTTGASR